MVNEFKVGDEVVDSVFGNGEVKETGRLLWVWFESLGRGAYRRSSQLRPCSQEKHQHQFQAGDQVAHEEYGSGKVVDFLYSLGAKDSAWPIVRFDSGRMNSFEPHELRPRNFLLKIAEEQEKKSDQIYQRFSEAFKTVGQQFNEVFNPDRFQRNAYGQLVDTVTGLSAESDGLVDIISIKETIREIS